MGDSKCDREPTPYRAAEAQWAEEWLFEAVPQSTTHFRWLALRLARPFENGWWAAATAPVIALYGVVVG